MCPGLSLADSDPMQVAVKVRKPKAEKSWQMKTILDY